MHLDYFGYTSLWEHLVHSRDPLFFLSNIFLTYTGLEVHSLLCQRLLHCEEGCTVAAACWLAQITHRRVTALFVLNCCKCTYAQLLSAIQQGGCIKHSLSRLSFCFWKPVSLLGRPGILILVLLHIPTWGLISQELEGTKDGKAPTVGEAEANKQLLKNGLLSTSAWNCCWNAFWVCSDILILAYQVWTIWQSQTHKTQSSLHQAPGVNCFRAVWKKGATHKVWSHGWTSGLNGHYCVNSTEYVDRNREWTYSNTLNLWSITNISLPGW